MLGLEKGEVHVCGDNSFGQIGMNKVECVVTPTRLTSALFSKRIAIDAACGMHYMMLLTSTMVCMTHTWC